MRHHHGILLLAACALATPSIAQSTFTLPAEYDLAWGRGSSSMLGGTSTRTQLVFSSPFPAGTIVNGFAIRPTAGIANNASFTATVEIRVSSTAAIPGSLSDVWASNVGNDEVVVLPQQVVTIPAMPANRGTGQFAEFTFATPFVFGTNGNSNICVDFLVYGRSAGAAWSTDRAFASMGGRAANHGIGCSVGTTSSTSTGGTYVDGSTVNFTVSGGLPNTLMVLVLSVNQKEVAPGVPGPFPLDLIGAAPGCELLLPLDIVQATVSSAAGASTLPITITGFSQFGFGGQWVALVPPTISNPAGIETLRSRAVWIGPEVSAPVGQSVYDLFDVNEPTATDGVNAVPIVKFITL